MFVHRHFYSVRTWQPCFLASGKRVIHSCIPWEGLPITYLTQKYKTTGPDFLGKSCSSTRRSSWSQFKCPLQREETVSSPAPKRFLTTRCNEVWGVTKVQQSRAVCPRLLHDVWKKTHSKCLRSGGDIILATFQSGNWTAKVQSVRVKAGKTAQNVTSFTFLLQPPGAIVSLKVLSRFSLEILIAKSFHNACNISLKAKPDYTASDSLFTTHMPAIASLGFPSHGFSSFRELLKYSCSMKCSSSNYHTLTFLLPGWYLSLLFSPIIYPFVPCCWKLSWARALVFVTFPTLWSAVCMWEVFHNYHYLCYRGISLPSWEKGPIKLGTVEIYMVKFRPHWSWQEFCHCLQWCLGYVLWAFCYWFQSEQISRRGRGGPCLQRSAV